MHAVIATATSVNDVTHAGALLHGEEIAAFGNGGYRGVDQREDARGSQWQVSI